jgi:N-acetylglucosaminyldiphosphoundecaprenol N-acetyl-beta-D-mannosaminyltransferase
MSSRVDRLAFGPTTVDFWPLADAARAIADGSLRGGVHLCNAYTLALAGERADVVASLATPETNLPDGMPVVWWAHRHGIPQAQRVYGPDLMEAVIDIGRGTAARHYLYGSTPEVLEQLQAAIAARWPGAEIAGVESPPFRDLSDDELTASARRAEAAGATIVWVGMGTPKQDLIVHRMANASDLTFVAIGAAFDFIAGTKSQAPRWMMRIGMEWFYRLITEPRRLWKRYLVYNAKFVRMLWHDRAVVRTPATSPETTAPGDDGSGA